MFNTLKYAKILEEVGFSREQAETSIKILVEIMEDKLASKQDLQEFRAASKQDLQDFAAASKQDLQEFKAASMQDFHKFKAASKQDLQEFKAASTHDLQEFKAASKQDFQELRTELQHSVSLIESKIVQVEYKLTIRMGTMLAASIAVLTAIQKLV